MGGRGGAGARVELDAAIADLKRVLVTNARLSKANCLLVAQSGHDGIARALFPAHTRFDGDAVVAVSTGTADGGPDAVDTVRVLATVAAERAIRNAC